MKHISPTKRYVVMYLPDYSHGFQMWGEYDTRDEAVDGWEKAMMASPMERPLIFKNVRFKVEIEVGE